MISINGKLIKKVIIIIMKYHKTLQELFSFPGFRAKQTLLAKFGDPKIRIVELVRRKKQASALIANLSVIVSTISH